MAGLLFGQSRNQPKNLVEFKAGKMNLKGTMVTPDKRKGLVYIFESDDGLRHFCWKDRKSGTIEDDLIVFPDDCEYKKVSQAKPGSRVFLLKFKASARKLFFWMQEPKDESDNDLMEKVNDALNNSGGSSSGGRTGNRSGNATPTPSEQDMQTLLSSMSQSQLMQLIGGMSELGGSSGLLAQLSQMGPGSGSSNSTGTNTTKQSSTSTSTAPPAAVVPNNRTEPIKTETTSSKPTAPATSSSKAIQLQDLQKILSNMQPSSSATTKEPGTDLSTGINSDLIQRIVSNPTTVQKLAPLLPQFGGPEVKPDPDGKQGVTDTLSSAQFQNALRGFCTAFPTGQLAPLVTQFNMGSDAVAAAQTGNLEAFLNAIQQDVDGKGQDAPSSKPKADEPEDMNVD